MLMSVTVVLSVIGSIFLAGRRDAQKDRKVADLEDYVETQERINDVKTNNTVDAATERLRGSGQFRD